jgi:hypothetical protein
MDTFYIIVLSIAVVLLILILTFVGIMMKRQDSATVFPPTVNTCPDFWTVDAGKCTIPIIGSPNALASNPTDQNVAPYASGGKIDPNNPLWAINGSAICNQRKWANSAGISWDGVSNYNGCK